MKTPGALLVLGVAAASIAGCGSGGGSSSMKLGAVAALARPGESTTTFKTYKYKTAIVSVQQAAPGDLKSLTLLGDTNKNDVAFYVTQKVTGVQGDYSDWAPESPDVYDSSGAEATPLITTNDLPQCVEHKPPAGFGPGQSFESCDVYLVSPGQKVGKVVLAGEGPGENDLTWAAG